MFVYKKKTELIQTRKSLWPFPRIRGSFAGSWLFLPKLEVEIKKTLVGNHFHSHGFQGYDKL